MATFTIAVVGASGVGKTTFLKRLTTGHFEKRYIPTIGNTTRVLNFHTTNGPITLNILDFGGREMFGGDFREVLRQADAAILMFDVTSRLSYNMNEAWLNEIRHECGNVPVVLCGNKVDVTSGTKVRDVEFHRIHDLKYYGISAKSNYNFEKPFLSLLKDLTGNSNIEFVA